MGKKDKKKLMAQKDKFIYGGMSEKGNKKIDGCIHNGISAEVANKIFGDMEGFASYAFNKSHAAAYATLAYQTAWLKKYYCKEFICALLNNRLNKIDEITKYVLYLKDKEMKVLPPDINKSRTVFRVEGAGVRFGLSALKGVGQGVMDSIIEEREKKGPFNDFCDFISRCIGVLNLRVVEGLIYAGAFDEFGKTRASLAAIYEPLVTRAKALNKQKDSAQISFFGDIIEDEKLQVEYPDLPELETNVKLAKEKEVLGVYVSGHPFDKYKNAFPECNFNCSALEDYVEDEDGNKIYNTIQDGMHITMAGIIGSFRRTVTKRTGAYMAILNLEDSYGSLECVCFPAVYEKVRNSVDNDKIVKISGKLDIDVEKGISCIIDDLTEVEAQGSGASSANTRNDMGTLWINATSLDDYAFDELISTLTNYQGDSLCKIIRGQERYRLPTNVHYCKALLAELYSVLEQDDVKFIY